MQKLEMKELLRAQPFRPFKIHLPEGRTVDVVHHDFALLSPNGRTLLAYGPDNSFNMIDVMLITSIEFGPPPTQPTSGSATNGPATT
ncbi:MAG TPA: hypothetical protein VH120_17395 [Gemmataceae bacterium]|jgi:hypothetical protein|nr:hypothetical protein [Gemmataceae bacterium]